MDSITNVLTGKTSWNNFDCHPLYHFVTSNNFVLPVVACVLYVVAIFGVIPMIRPTKAGGIWRHLFAFWNLFLSGFSWVGVIVCVPYVYSVFQRRGVWHLVCSDDMMLGSDRTETACYGAVGFMMSLFMLSKIPELLDTFFLAWMNKQIIFLHWYHHITVLLYSWFAYQSATPTAVFFGTMNYSVHAVMYFYFGASIYTKALGFMRQPITSLQLVQMFLGMCGTAAAYYYTYYDSRGCSKTYVDSGFFFYCGAIYFSYFLLFGKLFFDSYISGTHKKELKAQGKKKEQ